ncbi:hypothetical protein HDU90_008343 [Geranomyces variabilis]|nr:hypothetical protein HDU90_008343 [Geranomyces variabilis]
MPTAPMQSNSMSMGISPTPIQIQSLSIGGTALNVMNTTVSLSRDQYGKEYAMLTYRSARPAAHLMGLEGATDTRSYVLLQFSDANTMAGAIDAD